jgi:uncharacterized protein
MLWFIDRSAMVRYTSAMKTYWFALFALLLSPVLAFAEDAPPLIEDFGPLEQVVVTTKNGPVTFLVEVADTDAERTQGLMFRTELADDSGMLFNFESPRPVAMWMKNTLIPLDIIFIDPKGRILSIARNARPRSLRSMPSGGVALAALEIIKGGARKYGIARGDIVHHPMFGNAFDAPEDADKALQVAPHTPKSASE